MSKRARGEGSVRQRPDGRWEARLSYTDPATGRRKSTSFYGATDEEARAELDKARGRVKVEAPVKDSSAKLSDWIEHWQQTALEVSPRKESTKDWYRTLARKHLKPAPFGAISLDKLRKSHIDGLLVGLRKKGLADSTVRSIYTVLRAVLADAKLDNLIAENTATRVPRPRVERTEARYLEPAEVQKVLSSAEGLRYRPVLELIAATGLRRGEAAALHWEHVDLTDKSLRVRKTLSRVGGKLLITEPKTARSRRTVPLSAATVSMLKTVKASQAAERLATGEKWTDSGLVFTTETGAPVDPRNILRTIQTAARKAKIADVGVHTLRHSAGFAWLEAGVHIRAVSDLLGHSSIAVTGDIYGHTSDSTTRAAVDALASTLGL